MTDVASGTISTAVEQPRPTALPAPVKPGWLTSEHALAWAAVLLTSFYASGLIPTSGQVAQVAAIAATLLTALGYAVSRTIVKTAGGS